jgi:hypothetical protein
LIVDESTSEDTHVSARESANVPSQSPLEISNFKWQQEMENQFDILVENIRPFIKDPELNAVLFRLIRKNRGITASISHEL